MSRRAAALALGILLLVPASAPAREGAHGHRYVILPFEDGEADPSRAWMREAMSVSLGEYFLGAGEEVVSRDDRLMAMDELSLPAGAPLTLASSIKLARHLAASPDVKPPDKLVVGKFDLDQGQISLSARVLDLDADRASAWMAEKGSLKDLLKLQRSLAHALLRRDGNSGGNLAAAGDEAKEGHDFPLVAYESYVRGVIDSSPSRQQSLLRKAIDQAPGYPKACYQLGRILAAAGKARDAEAVLKRASTDPVPYAAEFHALLGSLALDAGRLSEAQAQAGKSLAVRDTADVRILRARIARAQNDPAGALAELDRAAALDPGNPDVDSLRRDLQKAPPPHP